MHVAPLVARRPSALVSLAVVAAAAALVGAITASPAFGQAAGGTRIGVVNVAKVSGKIQEVKAFQTSIQNDQELMDAQVKGHQAELNELQQELKNLKPDSDQYNQKFEQFQDKLAGFNAMDQVTKAKLLQKVSGQTKKLFNEIQQVVSDVAKRKNIDLVIVQPEVQMPAAVQNVNPEQLNQLIAQKTVLYAGPNVDLTDEVAAELDARFTAGKK